MRDLIANIYKILYRKTGKKVFSLLFALAYVSAMNLIILYGIVLLLEDWRPEMSVLFKFFTFPSNMLMFISMMFINFLMMLPLKNLSKEVRKHASIPQVLVYSFAPLLVFLYSHYFEHTL